MVYQASSSTQDISAAAGGDDYFDHLKNAGGTQITSMSSLSKGDVVQEGEYGGHTYIIVGAVSGSTFDVVDSNHDYMGTVMHYHRTVTLDSDDRAYRFGSVSSTGGTAPSWGGVGNAKFLGTDKLTSGQVMTTGQYILSDNAQYALLFQTDGNLVLYNNKSAIWNSHTAGSGATKLAMQSDGNLVLYTAGSKPVWNSQSAGHGSSYAVIQSDGNFVVYADTGGWTWQAHKGGHTTYNYFGSDKLTNGQAMLINQYLKSADKRYALLLQSDGNLVLYGPGYHVIWDSQTAGKGATRLVMQGDGNLVLYTPNGAPVWNSKTAGRGPSYTAMQGDGNLVVYANTGNWTWQSGTAGKI